MSGSTCSFTQGGTTVAIFCENGCCDQECCTDLPYDETALFISLAVILGLLVLIALIILLLYCCCKRSKDDKNFLGRDNRVASISTLSTGKDSGSFLGNGYFTASKLVQTDEQEATPQDHVLWGRSSRWSAIPTDKKGYRRRSRIWANKPRDGFSQTDGALQNEKSTSTPRSTSVQTKSVPTPRAKPKQWQYSHQEKSLEKSPPKYLDTYKNMPATQLGPYYPVHYHPGIERLNTSGREPGSSPSPNNYDEETL